MFRSVIKILFHGILIGTVRNELETMESIPRFRNEFKRINDWFHLHQGFFFGNAGSFEIDIEKEAVQRIHGGIQPPFSMKAIDGEKKVRSRGFRNGFSGD